MAKYEEVAEGVFYAREPVPVMGAEEIDFLKAAVKNTVKGRARICLHADPGQDLHEMMILLTDSGYIRPHRHLDKPESLHVIEGEADIVLFDDAGRVEKCMRVGGPGSGLPFFFRIHRPVYHTQLLRTEYLLFHETTRGPFSPLATEYGPWSPEEGSAGVADYVLRLEEQLTTWRKT